MSISLNQESSLSQLVVESKHKYSEKREKNVALKFLFFLQR